MRRASALRSTIVALVCLACGEDAPATGSPAPSSGAAPAPAVAEVPPAAAALAPMHVHYALAEHLARAEVREGATSVLDFGVRGGAKYTLGGWQTRLGADHEIDGTRALVIPRETGKILLPVDREGPLSLALRARAFAGDGRTTVYVDGETVAHARLSRDGFEVIRVELPGGLPVGEHFLQLRVTAAGTHPGVGAAGVALDWVRVGAPGEVVETAPAAPEALAVTDGGAPSLRLPDGVGLGFALEVPEGARLRGAAVGAGLLTVTAVRDGGAAVDVGEARGTAEGQPFDLDLAPLAGQVARLDLRARGGVTLRAPAVVVPGAPAAAAAAPAARPKNVLVYLIDTLRADKLEPYAPDTRVQAPGFTRYVRSAALFSSGRTNENWTKPSVASLLTSLLPWEHTATTGEASLPPSVNTLAEVLDARGFHTGAFVCNGYVSRPFGFQQGFSFFRNYIKEGRRTQARFVAADVLEWLDARPADQPFFLYVHTIDPHVPYMPPQETLERYDPEPYEGPVDFGRDRELLEKVKSGRLRLNDRDRRRLEALYDGEITYHDVHMAAILDGLERRGLADDTVVVITADHGEEFFDHGSVGHGHSLYEELLHIPFVVRVPGVSDAGLRIDDDVALVDIMPTVLDAVGVEGPAEMSGRSLLPLMRGQGESAPRVTVSGFMDGWRAVHVGDRKLIQRTAERFMLYDLGADPDEATDRAADAPVEVRYLRGLLGLALTRDAGRSHRAEAAVVDAETRAALRALGYVGASAPPQ